MMIRIISSLVMILSIVSLNVELSYSHTYNGKEMGTIDVLKEYMEMPRTVHGNWIWPVSTLRSKGVNLESLANEVLADIAFVDYWDDALGFLAVYNKENRSRIVEEILSFLNRKEEVYILSVIESKITSLSILSSIIEPKSFEDVNMKNVLLNDVAKLFVNEKPTTPQYWIKRFELEELLSTLDEPRAGERKYALNRAEAAAGMCVHIAGRLYHLTEDRKYMELIEYCRDHEQPPLSSAAITMLSDLWLKYWRSGQLDLFASLNQPAPNPTTEEEMEAMRRAAESIRAAAAEHQAQKKEEN